ncbi:hypothetical protein, partial [Mycobacterium sp. UM_Kg27]|uniref:hypothetical protein n=1 Tax=Mycobacterium sp. UM_Kg27 TaxID=1545693 RepID=UPI00128BC0AD
MAGSGFDALLALRELALALARVTAPVGPITYGGKNPPPAGGGGAGGGIGLGGALVGTEAGEGVPTVVDAGAGLSLIHIS